jgi:hypothetical protein
MAWIIGLLGAAIIDTPFALQLHAKPIALWSSFILGGTIVVVASIKLIRHDKARWEYWVAGLSGLAALIAPFALGFTGQTVILWTSVLAGSAVAVLAGYEVLVPFVS